MLGTRNVIQRLRREGYDVSCGYVMYVLRDGLMPPPQKGPANVFLWTDIDVARLRRILAKRGRRLDLLTPMPRPLA